jgi:methylase of polypeptide subunit release factors
VRYYRVDDDWLTYLEGDLRSEVICVIRDLGLQRLQKYPPPKREGLPFGNESRVLSRYVRGKSSQLDASAFSGTYRRFASDRDRLLYDAFRQNKSLSQDRWSEILGKKNVEVWITNKLLRRTANGNLISRFSIVGLDGLLLVVDPLNDHGNPHETVALPDDFRRNGDDANIQPFHHTYIGLDSLRQIEVMDNSSLPNDGRYLDCGPGAGALLLYFGRRYTESMGIDINTRATKLSRFNAELNGLENCRVFEDDAVNLGDRYGKFDLVSWNLPFIFMPPEKGDNSIDAFGGEMGIGLCLEFVDSLPHLLTENGTACIAAVSPILNTGENVLETKLKDKIGRLGLDSIALVTQLYFANTSELWSFHKRSNIHRFESVYLFFTHGSGKLQHIEPTVARKVLDLFREKLYQRKFAEK